MMPFDFRLFLTLFTMSLQDPMTPKRRRVVWILLFALPVWALVNAVCLALDHIFYPDFRKTAIREPVFIIGHSRSGTSLLHRLMFSDRERFSGFRTYELFLPSILQKKFVRFIARCDRDFFGHALARRIRAWEEVAFAQGRQMHPMSLFGPEEDEFLMAIPFCSGSLAMLFPYLRELRPYNCFDTMLPEWKRRRVMDYYRECVRRQLYLEGGDRIHLSKNPVFSEKVDSLIETFPDARFVVMVRNPYETIPSIMKMMERNWRATDCDRERVRDSLEVLAENSVSAYLHPFEVLDQRLKTVWTAVRYTELVESPKHEVENVYRDLGIELTPEMQESLAEEESRAQEHRAEHVYALSDFGLSREEIHKRLEPLFHRFGWVP